MVYGEPPLLISLWFYGLWSMDNPPLLISPWSYGSWSMENPRYSLDHGSMAYGLWRTPAHPTPWSMEKRSGRLPSSGTRPLYRLNGILTNPYFFRS